MNKQAFSAVLWVPRCDLARESILNKSVAYIYLVELGQFDVNLDCVACMQSCSHNHRELGENSLKLKAQVNPYIFYAKIRFQVVFLKSGGDIHDWLREIVSQKPGRLGPMLSPALGERGLEVGFEVKRNHCYNSFRFLESNKATYHLQTLVKFFLTCLSIDLSSLSSFPIT